MEKTREWGTERNGGNEGKKDLGKEKLSEWLFSELSFPESYPTRNSHTD